MVTDAKTSFAISPLDYSRGWSLKIDYTRLSKIKQGQQVELDSHWVQ